MTVRPGIAAFSIGDQLAQRTLRHHHPADVLRQVPRKADELLHQIHQPPAERTRRIDAGFGTAESEDLHGGDQSSRFNVQS